MRKMLHLVNKSPLDRPALDSCLRLASSGSGVLLIEDGVYAVLANSTYADEISKRMTELNFYVLGPDLTARGLDDLAMIEGITTVDYDGFVELVVEHAVTQSWM